MAASDGNIDDKEAAALAKELQDAPFYVKPLAREVLMSVVIDLANVMEQYNKDSRDVVGGLREVATILDSKATPEHSNNFKKAMLSIGANVAKASGGGLFHRNPISDEEEKALVLVALSLDIVL